MTTYNKMPVRLFDLPTPIIDIIYEFSGNQKKLKKKSEDELLFNVSIETLNHYRKYCMNRRNHPSSKFFGYRHLLGITFHNNCDNLDKKKHFNNLKNCKCCERHQRNVPKNINDTWDEDPILYINKHNLDLESSNGCKCKCRHYKRIIANTYKPELYVDDYFTSLMD